MNSEARRLAFRELAEALEGVDREVYLGADKDPLEPVIGHGDAAVPIAIFGRDPGRDEVIQQMPFIGAGGQKVRKSLYQHRYGKEMPDFEASIEVGSHYFWANTVPFKPIGNKAWSMKVKKQFQPLVADLLVNSWSGSDIISLGRDAFFWFAINQEREVKQRLEQFWQRDDRFTTALEVEITSVEGVSRTVRLHPLPHPSPLNATWYKRFPDLLLGRLDQLE
ncbi:MAG: uracil-DNA glycosylase [Gammaproteobacteria bacterium]|nr:uracil-DNA glycosylase [Gammaproteobacteria bacterium]